jgi:hypothetical protein
MGEITSIQVDAFAKALVTNGVLDNTIRNYTRIDTAAIPRPSLMYFLIC